MKYDPEKDFYECLDGCGEFWPATKEYSAAKMFWQEVRDKKSILLSLEVVAVQARGAAKRSRSEKRVNLFTQNFYF